MRDDTFVQAYLECALWASTDEEGEPLDAQYGVENLAPVALAQAKRECEAVLTENDDDIGRRVERAGGDFWLTRNGHGAGFWDGDWLEPHATRLTEASHAAGGRDLYVGDDGQLYFTPEGE